MAREDALSRERIVDEAIALLDDEGESGLTFRALATRLATGPGAIYWHVTNKDELLVAASNAVIERAMSEVSPSAKPREAIRSLASGVFEAIDAHPWVGAQASLTPMLQVFERIGQQLQELGVPERAQFTTASALLSYIMGVSVQNAANARRFEPSVDRADFLDRMATEWEALDAQEYPFTRSVAAQMREHDDLAEFLAGIDLILAGVATSKKRRRR